MNTKEKLFFDIHCHTYNLSHAGLLAFLNRFFLNLKITLNDFANPRKLIQEKIPNALKNWIISGRWLKAKRIKIIIPVFFILFLNLFASIFMSAWLSSLISSNILRNIITSSLFFYLAKYSIFTILFIFSFLFLFISLCYIFLQALNLSMVREFLKSKIGNSIKKGTNLFSLIENDLGRQFLYMELDVLSLDKKLENFVKRVKDNHDDLKEINKIKEDYKSFSDKRISLKDTEIEIDRFIIFPLMMDFNYRSYNKKDKLDIHYNLPPRKAIIDQCRDLYYGLKEYRERSIFEILEVYPFLGVNPKNYPLGIVKRIELDVDALNELMEKRLKENPESNSEIPLSEKIVYLKKCKRLGIVKELNKDDLKILYSCTSSIEDQNTIKEMNIVFVNNGYSVKNSLVKLLHKYFKNYEPDLEKLSMRFKREFPTDKKNSKTPKNDNGYNIEEKLIFSGIKVYPPLDFDPWPELTEEMLMEWISEEGWEEAKTRFKDRLNEIKCVNFLYQFCCEKRIPITTHCSENGFMVISKDESWKYSHPETWEKVLKRYPGLKLNIAHFGSQCTTNKTDWKEKILELIQNYDYVFTDFSYRGVSDDFYREFSKAIKKNSTLKNHSLFGTDFLINLLEIDSYSEYIKKFVELDPLIFSREEKTQFSMTVPQRFLFEMGTSKDYKCKIKVFDEQIRKYRAMLSKARNKLNEHIEDYSPKKKEKTKSSR